MKKPAE